MSQNEHDSHVKRRSFLFYGVTAVGGTLLAMSTGAGYWLLRRHPPLYEDGFCDADQLAFIRALGQLYFPPETTIGQKTDWEQVIRGFDTWISVLPDLEQQIFLVALRVLERTPVLASGWSGFSNMDVNEQRSVVKTWEEDEGSVYQEAISLFRGLVSIQVFDSIDVRRSVGFVEGCGI